MSSIEKTILGVHKRTSVGATLVVVLPLLICCWGCDGGTPLGSVNGTVTYNGQPLDCAMIEFIPLERGHQSVGYTDDNGYYVLQYTLQKEGALLGRHQVRVKAYPEPGSPPVHVPAEYGRKSQIEFEVKPGANTYDITLESNDEKNS
jgi:hypothetical protein